MRAVEGVAVSPDFWRGKRVLLTGHTGFKGGWLSLWLQKLGATVAGYALPPDADENLFELACVEQGMESVFADIADLQCVQKLIREFHPEIVFHLAAQPLVRASYSCPVETYRINVMGTVHLLEAVRTTNSCRVVVVITSDKCYENKEWAWGYRETDPPGGDDPYSSSKGCAELVVAAYRKSFFEIQRPVAVASARAGNVVGGGDFSKDRLIPDFVAAIRNRLPLKVRYPDAIRPWQHVLDPLSGYLLLAEKLWENPKAYSQGWNFGSSADDARTVRWIVEKLEDLWGEPFSWDPDPGSRPHEARLLTLDSTKARLMLEWKPRWRLEQALKAVVDWYKAYAKGDSMRELVMQQIASYETSNK